VGGVCQRASPILLFETMPLKKFAKVHRFSSKDNEFSEQAKDAEEFLYRECERLKINFRTITTAERMKLLKKFGALRAYRDGIYDTRDAI
jgi:hypothetical protein